MTDIRLDRMDSFPPDLARTEPRDILRLFPNPTLISIDGRRGDPLFVSVLLHGNETTGYRVLQALAARFSEGAPARPLLIFIGNTQAAAEGLRVLPGRPDFNRIWRSPDTPEGAVAAEVVREAMRRQVFASIDIHNNSGANPIYGCVNALTPQHLALAALFSRVCVYYTNPPTTQSIAFSGFCPAVTVECGRPDEPAGVAQATQLVLDALSIDHLDSESRAARDLAIYHTVGRILVDPETAFCFAPADAELVLPADLETLNFSPLPVDRVLAWARTEKLPLKVVDENGRDLTARFLTYEQGEIRLAQPAIPSMFTRVPYIIRQDCLGYLMEPLPDVARSSSEALQMGCASSGQTV